MDNHISHLQYDVHYLYEQQGYQCQWVPFSHPPSQGGSNKDQGHSGDGDD